MNGLCFTLWLTIRLACSLVAVDRSSLRNCTEHAPVVDPSVEHDDGAIAPGVNDQVDAALKEAAALVAPDASPMDVALAYCGIADSFNITSASQPKDRVHIEVAITLYHSALGLLPAGNAVRALFLHNLAHTLKARFELAD